jgi:tRNA modification GTPase
MAFPVADTIVALASGAPPSGVAVVRVSGPAVGAVSDALLGRRLIPRKAELLAVRDRYGDLVDTALVIGFIAPASFTGEDVVEFQCHGSPAVVSRLIQVLLEFDGVRLAQPGEFTRRAFDNGKLDLSSAEGLADLIEAETESQRKQALRQLGGGLASVVESWRTELIGAMALVEADIDFPDEDLPEGIPLQVQASIAKVRSALIRGIETSAEARQIRDGLRVVLLGRPNAGKSSLLNWLAGSDVVMVSPIAGTTRDVVEVRLRLGGHLVLVSDTAGLRQSDDVIEQEGVRRALRRADDADVRVLVIDNPEDGEPQGWVRRPNDLVVFSKADLRSGIDVAQAERPGSLSVSVRSGEGLNLLLAELEQRAQQLVEAAGDAGFTRARHVEAAGLALAALVRLEVCHHSGSELIAEELRLAARALGRITGRVDVDDVLDALFSRFCIGK